MKFAICNEIFQGWNIQDTLEYAAKSGYDAVEIVPFTIAKCVGDIPADERRKIRDAAARNGIGISGIHWVLAQTEGLHLAHPESAVRARTSAYLCDLVDFCADLGGRFMVFGSPNQRATTGGLTREQATRHYVEGLANVAPHAAGHGVTILVEALPKGQCDVVQTLDEAASIVREIDSPGVRTMFDTHNAVDETEPHAVLLDKIVAALGSNGLCEAP